MPAPFNPFAARFTAPFTAYGNLRISARILVLVAAAVVMVLSVILVVYAANMTMVQAADRLAAQRSVAELAASLEREATTARALLLRYAVSRDPEIADSIRASLDQVAKGLRRMTTGPVPEGPMPAAPGREGQRQEEAILAAVADAETRFAQVNALGMAIGSGTDDVVFGGLLATMRRAIEALEAELRIWPNLDSALRLVESMRRAELEYLLESRPGAEGQHRKSFRELEYQLGAGILDPATGGRLLAVAGEYRRSFVAVTEKMTPFRTGTADLVAAIDRLRADLVILAAASNTAMAAAAEDQREATRRGEITLWTLSAILAALFIALALATARSITRPIQAIEAALTGIGPSGASGGKEEGNKDGGGGEARIPTSIPGTARRDEIGSIARTLQAAFEQLDRTRGDLVEAEKQAALGGLVAGVAHEINTPIGVALTAASILTDETAALERAYRQEEMTEEVFTAFLTRAGQAARVVTENLARGAELIRSFKQVAVDSHQSEAEPVVVLPYLRNALISLAHEMKTGQILLSVDGDAQATVRMAPTQLWQIISNLILNARVHAFEGLTDRWVTVEVRSLPGKVVIRVADNGKGMPDDVRRRCFEPFFTTRRGSGGSGLGLSIVHSIVTGVGGRITVSSRPGNGTTFLVQLPAAE